MPMFDLQQIPEPSFLVGQYVTICGPFAGDWLGVKLVVCGIDYKKDLNKFTYCLIDSDGFMCDGWTEDDVKESPMPKFYIGINEPKDE